MDLSSLYTTLPPGQLAQAERQMMEKFKAAALSITTLYKSSLNTSKQAYTAGYAACLSDILQTLHASLVVTADNQHPQAAEEAGRTLGRLMDWIEARQEALKLQDEDEREDSEATTPAMGMGMGPGPAAGMHAESSAQAASRQAAADLSRTGSLPGRQRARQRVSGSPRMEDDEAPADAEPSTLPIPVVRTDHQRMARAPSHSRQRDTLVQAMNRHQSERRGRGRSEVAEDALIVSNSTRGLAPQEGASPPVYRDQPRGSMFEASSPLQAYAPNTPFQPRPAKALPHHAKSKQGNTITANPGSSSIFAPDLPVDIPFIPLFNPDATGSVDASLVSGGATPDADVRVGAKRPLMVEPSVFGAGRGDGTASAPPIGVNKALRRRMGVRGDAGERWTGGETASTPVSDSEERDRKRVTRRG